MTTLIAIPYFGVPGEILDNAVRHALAQTGADVVVLVAGDGQEPPVSVRHDRLVVGTFPVNRGAPFTQQAMLLGNPFRFYAPHGADDWIEPDHVARLRALQAGAAGSMTVWYHRPPTPDPELLRSTTTWVEFGVFETELLRSIGGYGPHEPCGQDSLMTAILLRTVGLALLLGPPSYHKLDRRDSLTHAADTRHGSPVREAVKVRNRAAMAALEELGWRDVVPIREFRESLVPAELMGELEERAADVARWLQ